MPLKKKTVTVRRSNPPTELLLDDIVSIAARAVEVFGSRDKAMRWLGGSVPRLGNRTPLSMLTTVEGRAEVEDTLGAIEHGIW
jgi:putative toxin-antitoxin system antitoxin component (TIGR02293 family)